jgi:hypothetical protein
VDTENRTAHFLPKVPMVRVLGILQDSLITAKSKIDMKKGIPAAALPREMC